MTHVEITYCVPCGYLDRALDTERAVLQSFGQSLDRVTLVTSDHGVFRVTVDGEQIWDLTEDEYDVDDIVRRVRAEL
ncbi:SelT/SelW/SelH family protein [Halosegnis rubeus]|jgi:selenoprotein W-related protein|uniref:SelT/SelW/SelH family protein n=1 Tax=Halosegnis rubeus TaxID=2212850 RepID=A0A5N5ULH6_9EURY|nr:Rdx family protein [Halosegnis rubeus]KAB7519174.1 SelT/SelW/SelH family protein [Halosegnis rubeus]